MAFEPIQRVLPKALQAAGISRQVTAARVVDEAARLLYRLWGEERARYLSVISFKNGVLKIAVSSAVALQEIKRQAVAVQNELNRLLGSRVVFSLDCFLR